MCHSDPDDMTGIHPPQILSIILDDSICCTLQSCYRMQGCGFSGTILSDNCRRALIQRQLEVFKNRMIFCIGKLKISHIKTIFWCFCQDSICQLRKCNLSFLISFQSFFHILNNYRIRTIRTKKMLFDTITGYIGRTNT